VLRDTWAPARRDLLSSLSLAARVEPQMLGADAPSLRIHCGLVLRGFDA
jgi:Tfp pilus assembly PilM family ATPase